MPETNPEPKIEVDPKDDMSNLSERSEQLFDFLIKSGAINPHDNKIPGLMRNVEVVLRSREMSWIVMSKILNTLLKPTADPIASFHECRGLAQLLTPSFTTDAEIEKKAAQAKSKQEQMTRFDD